MSRAQHGAICLVGSLAFVFSIAHGRSETARSPVLLSSGEWVMTAAVLPDSSLSPSTEAGESSLGWARLLLAAPQIDTRAETLVDADGVAQWQSGARPSLRVEAQDSGSTPGTAGRGDGGGWAAAEIAGLAGELSGGSVPTPSGIAGNVLALAQAIEEHFPPAARAKALSVALCESRGDPDAVNGPHRGVWQINGRFWGPVPFSVEAQTAQAARIHEEAGFTPWECR